MPENTTPTGAVAEKPEIESQLDARNQSLVQALGDDERAIQQHKLMLLEKWSGVRKGKYHKELDVIGDGSVEKGFPRLRNDTEKLNMALLLENQLKFQRSKEVPVVGGRVLMQDTTTADEALPTKFAMPIVRRVYATVQQGDWTRVQPLPGPSGYVFWLDFLREADLSNILTPEYNYAITPELGVPPKAKLSLQRKLVAVIKQMLGLTWSLESEEDARAQLGIDVEGELTSAFAAEMVRTLFQRHLTRIWSAVNGTDTTFTGNGAAVGTNLPSAWAGPGTVVTLPANNGTISVADRKSQLYNALVDADVQYQRVNFRPTNRILAGYGLAAFLSKMITVTSAATPDQQLMSSVGISTYGTYEARWVIQGTSVLPDNAGIMYAANEGGLEAAHVYAPYIPAQLMPAVYGDYDPVTGNYQNRDAWTRNMRERSADFVTRPYGFLGIQGPSGLTF